MLPKNVYVIDSDPEHLEWIQGLLTPRGVSTIVFARVTTFLEWIDYDDLPQSTAIIAEIRLPDLSGLDLLDILCADEMYIPTMLTSQRIDVPVAVEAMYRGAGYILEKPFGIDDLLLGLRRVIAKPVAMDPRKKQVEKRIAALSPRQRQMLINVFEGKTNKEIAEALKISIKTVELHRASMMQKMGAHSLAELIKIAAYHSQAIYGVSL
ncbi:MAG: LuxR C-terminal-related transcriptional regulator [Pseudomonadota bacterium]